jgi:ATP-dependent Lon protease
MSSTYPINIKNDVTVVIDKKIVFFQDVIQRTILYYQKNKILDILGVSDLSNCINTLFELSGHLTKLIQENYKKEIDTEEIISGLQLINNELSSLFKLFGTDSFEDFLFVCFGNTYSLRDVNKDKFELLKKYFHPTSYKILAHKKEEDLPIKKTGKISIVIPKDGIILSEKSRNLDCINISTNSNTFHLKVYGIQLIVHNTQQNKSLIVIGIVDDIIIDILNNKFVTDIKKQLLQNIPPEQEFTCDYFNRFLKSLILKDYLLKDYQELYSMYIGYITNVKSVRSKNMSQIMRDFLSSNLFYKRLLIIQLLVYLDKYENQYLAYLLYDLLSNDLNGHIDTQEQTILFDSFPWSTKQYFKDAMKNTIQYTNDLLNFDSNKIPIEQQICLLKVSDNVKEKAMQKLKEIKSKTDDSGSKARQYLDGLVKIPFGVNRREPILKVMENIKVGFNNLVKKHNIIDIPCKKSYTSLEISHFLRKIKGKQITPELLWSIKSKFTMGDKNNMYSVITKILSIIKKYNIVIDTTMKHSKKDYIRFIETFIEMHKNNVEVLNELVEIPSLYVNDIIEIETNYNKINEYMTDIFTVLDESVYGHENAKKQIARIVGQWINGEQDGYCFGFEGPPGVGKTSLAKKGLSNCLKDEDKSSRPFSMIQMGGDSNGSSLHGHNYTYVGSTWGSIVQILIDKKCMNPIIFIDEIDKISKTEHGKEIVGILTHLLDPSQNDCFQDKYFSGIDLDLSKALFILSYNDVDEIDRVLLDRIHRIKFSNLSIEDKLVICRKHILPEVYKKMGLEDMILIEDETLKSLIEGYTNEPGVRKLKEILFEIVGEVNLDILRNFNHSYVFPFYITMEDVKNKYFKEKHSIKHKQIFWENRIGFINGLWANSMGQGGVIPIQVKYYPADKFLDLKLTGMQGDVMKESMNVALTMAWNLTPDETKDQILKDYKDKMFGIHIHCPEGAVPKDGPSAGAAITTSIYSVFNNKKIKKEFGITGEISLDGYITEIGGLDLKILGGIKSGITSFIFPKENQRDLDKFLQKYKDNKLIEGIGFIGVEKIEEVFEIIFDN